MSQYNDYMLNLATCVVYKADQYAHLLDGGNDNCCLKTQLQVLHIYARNLPEMLATDFITNYDINNIVFNSSIITNNYLGDLNNIIINITVSTVIYINPPNICNNGKYIFPYDPTAADDITRKYNILDEWLNSISGDVFICISNDMSRAIWNKFQYVNL